MKKKEPTQYSCWALDCTEKFSRKKVMCPLHWRMVPAEVKAWIERSYKAGDRKGNRKAVLEAVRGVYKLERPKREAMDMEEALNGS